MATSTLPVLTHAVAWTIQGDDIRGAMTCTAPAGGPCRLTCSGPKFDSCESWSTDEGSCRHGALVDARHCQAVEWMEATSLLDQHGGEQQAPLVPGPVEIWWDEGWLWAYPGYGQGALSVQLAAARRLLRDLLEVAADQDAWTSSRLTRAITTTRDYLARTETPA